MGLSILMGKPYLLITQTSISIYIYIYTYIYIYICIYTCKYQFHFFRTHLHIKKPGPSPRSFLEKTPQVPIAAPFRGRFTEVLCSMRFGVLQRLASNVVPRVAQRWAFRRLQQQVLLAQQEAQKAERWEVPKNRWILLGWRE